jgi:predicted transcriptional regulator
MRTKGTAELTKQMSVACTPAMKQQLQEAAAARGVNPSVIARWAVQDWLSAHETAQTAQTAQTEETG